MTRITKAEIDEMKKRGYEADTIRKAEARLALLQRGEQVATQIRRAFSGVTLGKGVGLHQAQGLDDYAEPEQLKRYRASDEKMNWEKIPAAELRRCSSSLSFFDADGMRFHLPAFLIADLRGEYGYGIDFHLTHLDDYGRSKFSTLDIGQRQAVKAFLLHILDDPDYEFDRRKITAALTQYWTTNDSTK